MARKRIGEILVQAGVLDEAKLRAALAEQRRWGGPLGRILVDMKLVSEDTMVQALSHQLNFPVVNLDARQLAGEVLDLVPAELAEAHSVVPFAVQGKFLDVAMADPTNLGIIDELRIRTRLNVRPYLAGPKMIERALARWYGKGAVPGMDFGPGPGGVATMDDEDAVLGTAPVGAQVFEPTTDHGLRPATGRASSSDLSGLASGPPPVAAPAVSVAAARRAQQYELAGLGGEPDRTSEILALQARVQRLEALVSRDEDVLRKLMSLMIEKGLVTREEILERIK